MTASREYWCQNGKACCTQIENGMHHIKNVFTTAVHVVLIYCKYYMHSHLLCMYTVGKLMFTSNSRWCVDDYS